MEVVALDVVGAGGSGCSGCVEWMVLVDLAVGV